MLDYTHTFFTAYTEGHFRPHVAQKLTIAAFELKHCHSSLAFPHVATDEDVANKVLYLTSSPGSSVNGSLVHIDDDAFESVHGVAGTA